jgi:hypothetical protein
MLQEGYKTTKSKTKNLISKASIQAPTPAAATVFILHIKK